MKKTILFILISFASLAHSQSVSWEKQFHFAKYMWGGESVETKDGYIVAIGMGDDSTGGTWIMKLNKAGEFQWKKYMDHQAGFISLLSKGSGVYSLLAHGDVGGKWDSVNKRWTDFSNIMDFNDNGEILWNKKQNTDKDHCVITEILSFGNGSKSIIAAGEIWDKKTGQYAAFIQKYNEKHDVQWADTFKLAYNTTPWQHMIYTQDNKIIMSGTAGGQDAYKHFSFLLELDTNGKKINYVPYQYTNDSDEQIDNIGQLTSGNILVESLCPHTESTLFKLADKNGNTLKQLKFDGVFPNNVAGWIPDGDSILLFTSFNLIDGPYTLLKLDTGLNTIWKKDFDEIPDYYNGASHIIRTSDGGALLLGSRGWVEGYSYKQDTDDVVMVKLDNNCNLGNPVFSGINTAKDKNGWILYPNPALDRVFINTKDFNYFGKSFGLVIFDSQGKQVLTNNGISNLLNEGIDINVLNKGLYMYNIYYEGDIISSGKFVKE